jgi:hypothetical protein
VNLVPAARHTGGVAYARTRKAHETVTILRSIWQSYDLVWQMNRK